MGRDIKVVFRNVAGLWNKDSKFWSGLRDCDVITLTESWVEKTRWSRVKERLPGSYVWSL